MSAEKTQKEYPDFCAEVEKLDAAALKSRIVTLQQQLEESEETREADEELQRARETAREYAAPYNDVKKAVKVKTKYLVELLKTRG